MQNSMLFGTVNPDDPHERGRRVERPWALPWIDGTETCATTDPDAFFPELGDMAKVNAARALCGRCPRQDACLTWALTAPEKYGYWGGTSRNQRARLGEDIEQGRATLSDVVERVTAGNHVLATRRRMEAAAARRSA
ncbi:WhiB family transcriptional regulator [Actinomycetospora aeridis]|uniref:Transcriptional regulator WhiB n=1 Tax=Actinomycetospora aeridis TaxID=3129231 RepID=A0ABU8N2C4_9PSEU